MVDNNGNIYYNINNIKEEKPQETKGEKIMAKRMFSENAAKVLTFLQQNAGDFTQNDIADATGLNSKGMTGVVNGLVRKGVVVRVDDTVEIIDGEKTKIKKVKYVKLTDSGAAADPETMIAG